MAPSATPSPKRILELDGVRGLAIILVLLWHYVVVPIPADAAQPLRFIRQLLSNTWSGVDLFFVLSGFLIAGILIDNRTSEKYFSAFYVRRVSRIFPLYYFFLCTFVTLRFLSPRLGAFTEALFYSPVPLAPYFVYLQNVAMALHGTFGNEFLAVTWSLAIEEHFYLLLPLIIRRVRPSWLPLTLLLLIGISLAIRATIFRGSLAAYVLTPWRLDGLFLGALLALLFRTPTVFHHFQARLRWIKSACAGLFLYFIYSSMTEEVGSLDHLFLFGVFFAGVILLSLADQSASLARLFRHPSLAAIGRVSYAIYLFHQLVNGLVHDILFGSLPRFDSLPTVLATVLAAATTYLLAQGTYMAFEQRFIAIGHRFSYVPDC
jgi:peptidoglycan/LPS O-acetylase OafA/YrhL